MTGFLRRVSIPLCVFTISKIIQTVAFPRGVATLKYTNIKNTRVCVLLYIYRKLRNESVNHTAHLRLYSHLYIFNSIIKPNTLFFTILSNCLLCNSHVKTHVFYRQFLEKFYIKHIICANSFTMTTLREERKLEDRRASSAAYQHNHISLWHH